jgi:hypothetical protein
VGSSLQALAFVGGLLTFAVFFAKRLYQRRIAPALSAAGAIAIVVGSVLCQAWVDDAINYVRFQVSAAKYRAVVAATEQRPALVAFPWGEGGFVGVNLFSTVLYDESEQILQPVATRTTDWISSAKTKSRILTTDSCQSQARRVEDHFFVVTTTC